MTNRLCNSRHRTTSVREWRQTYRHAIAVISLFILFFTTAHSAAAIPELRYIPDRELLRNIVLENESVRYTITVDGTVRLAAAVHKASGVDLMFGNPPLTFASIRQARWIDDVGFQLFTVDDEKTEDRIAVTIRQQSSYFENSAVVTQTFTLGAGPELSWQVRVLNSATTSLQSSSASYGLRGVRTSDITFPVMQRLKLGDDSAMHYFIPAQVPHSELRLYAQPGNFFCIDNPDDLIFYFTQPHDPKMPVDIYDEQRGVYFHVLDTAFDWNFTDRYDFTSRVFRLTQQSGEETVIMNCRIAPHTGDWHAAFQAFKDHIRSNFDFTYYKRPVQEKYRQRLVSHFTFLYGHDIYNPETNEFDIDRFLDEGDSNFGGYDYMLLWHDYPRMGIDNRNQFAMYEDMPGGLSGLKDMVNKAHARDVQVFIPYKPWDIMRGREDHFKQEARISQAVGADGVFLDTMSESDIAFRDALDAVNPENVFVSEGRPDLAAAQLVTGSWDKSTRFKRYPFSHVFPQVDLFRFIIPEHNVMHSDRAGRDRRNLVYVSLFNGTGLIVWEDIFGEINRFSSFERTLVHRYNRIIHENRDAYLTDNPVPLMADLRKDLYVNAFPIASKCVYPAYQLGRENVDRRYDDRLIGPFMEVNHPDNWHYVDVWNHQVIPAEKKNGKTRLVFPEEPTDVMSCIVAMPENLRIEEEKGVLRISAAEPLDNATIQINTVSNLTMMENEALTISGNRGEVLVSDINREFPYLVVVKLMQGDVLKDEVILDVSWRNSNSNH